METLSRSPLPPNREAEIAPMEPPSMLPLSTGMPGPMGSTSRLPPTSQGETEGFQMMGMRPPEKAPKETVTFVAVNGEEVFKMDKEEAKCAYCRAALSIIDQVVVMTCRICKKVIPSHKECYDRTGKPHECEQCKEEYTVVAIMRALRRVPHLMPGLECPSPRWLNGETEKEKSVTFLVDGIEAYRMAKEEAKCVYCRKATLNKQEVVLTACHCNKYGVIHKECYVGKGSKSHECPICRKEYKTLNAILVDRYRCKKCKWFYNCFMSKN